MISDNEMEDIIKIIKSLEDSGLLLKRITERVQKGGFLSMLLGTLGTSLLGNILSGKGINRAGEGAIAKRQGRVIVREDYGNRNNKMDF